MTFAILYKIDIHLIGKVKREGDELKHLKVLKDNELYVICFFPIINVIVGISVIVSFLSLLLCMFFQLIGSDEDDEETE